jgi:hypothetical protein
MNSAYEQSNVESGPENELMLPLGSHASTPWANNGKIFLVVGLFATMLMGGYGALSIARGDHQTMASLDKTTKLSTFEYEKENCTESEDPDLCKAYDAVKACAAEGTHIADCCEKQPLKAKMDDICKCAASGDDCSKVQCCDDPNMKCFKKNDHWSSCKRTCTENDPDDGEWKCSVLSKHNLVCAHDVEDCILSGCCVDDSKTCYEKDPWWASCRTTGSCTAGEKYEHDPPEYSYPWTCKSVTNHVDPDDP